MIGSVPLKSASVPMYKSLSGEGNEEKFYWKFGSIELICCVCFNIRWRRFKFFGIINICATEKFDKKIKFFTCLGRLCKFCENQQNFDVLKNIQITWKLPRWTKNVKKEWKISFSCPEAMKHDLECTKKDERRPSWWMSKLKNRRTFCVVLTDNHFSTLLIMN